MYKNQLLQFPSTGHGNFGLCILFRHKAEKRYCCTYASLIFLCLIFRFTSNNYNNFNNGINTASNGFNTLGDSGLNTLGNSGFNTLGNSGFNNVGL